MSYSSKNNKKRSKASVKIGKVYVLATFNNTIVTVSDIRGNVLAWSTAGSQGFKGAKKSTPHAAQVTTQAVMDKAKDMYGLETVVVYVKGPGGGREAAIRSVVASGITVTTVKEITPLSHNGVRPRKKRRV